MLRDTSVLTPLSRMTLTSRSNKKKLTKIVIQLDINMYIGRRKFLSQVRKSYKKEFHYDMHKKLGGVFPCSPCSFGAFELAIIGNGYDFV